MKKNILKEILTLFMSCILLLSCSDNDNSAAYVQLENAIQEAELLISNTTEGVEEGNIAPGSKDILQTRIDWAYFILENSGRDKAYENAVVQLTADIEAFHGNIVSAGIPLFGFGSKMNLGLAHTWQMEESFSVECRVRYTEFASGDQNIISCEGNSKGWMLRGSGNKVQFYINQGGWRGLSSPVLELNRWYHIAVTYRKNDKLELYLDGEIVGSTTCLELGISELVDLQAGTAPSYANRYMRGYIQDLSIWSDVRTAEEVSADVACNFTGNEEGLKAYWPLNLNVGTQIEDKTGNYTARMSEITWQTTILEY